MALQLFTALICTRTAGLLCCSGSSFLFQLPKETRAVPWALECWDVFCWLAQSRLLQDSRTNPILTSKRLEIKTELFRSENLCKIIESTAKATADHTPRCHIHTDFKSHWGCRLHHCPCSMPENPFGEGISPNIQPHPPSVQLEALSLRWRKFLHRKLNPYFQDWKKSQMVVNLASRRIWNEPTGFGSCCKLCCNLLWAGKDLSITNCCSSKEDSKAGSCWFSLEPERWNQPLRLWKSLLSRCPCPPLHLLGCPAFLCCLCGGSGAGLGFACCRSMKRKSIVRSLQPCLFCSCHKSQSGELCFVLGRH